MVKSHFYVFLIAVSTFVGASTHTIILKFESTVDVATELSAFDVVSSQPVAHSPIYRVVFNGIEDVAQLHRELRRLRSVRSTEDRQEGDLVGAEEAFIIDQRTIGILDDFDIDQRTIGILDDDDEPFLALYSRPHTFQVRAVEAWPYATGVGSIVAVIDTGVDLYHDFLSPNLMDGWDFVDDDALPLDERYEVDSNQNGLYDEGWGHGTHVAGIIKTIAPNVTIMPLRAVDSDGGADLFHILQAMSYAIEKGANVINMSMSIGEPSPALLAMIDKARKADVLVVTSAGNRNESIMRYPATEVETLAVTSVNEENIKSDFANYCREVDVSAPGEWIISCHPGNRYVVRSGTSMAAPIVAGQAAIIIELAPSASENFVRNRIINSSLSIDSLNTPYRHQLGRGLVDVFNSITVQPE